MERVDKDKLICACDNFLNVQEKYYLREASRTNDTLNKYYLLGMADNCADVKERLLKMIEGM